MGGRYGASDDGSSEYQDRWPDKADRSAEQQTIAEAMQADTDRQRQSTDSDSPHPFASLRASSGGTGPETSGSPTPHDVDSTIAEYIADQIAKTGDRTAEKVDPDE